MPNCAQLCPKCQVLCVCLLPSHGAQAKLESYQASQDWGRLGTERQANSDRTHSLQSRPTPHHVVRAAQDEQMDLHGSRGLFVITVADVTSDRGASGEVNVAPEEATPTNCDMLFFRGCHQCSQLAYTLEMVALQKLRRLVD